MRCRELHGAREPEQLVDGGAHRHRSCPQALELRWVVEQRGEGVGDQVRGRLVASQEEERARAHDLIARQRVTV